MVRPHRACSVTVKTAALTHSERGATSPVVSKLFGKGTDGKFFWLCGPCHVFCHRSTLQLWRDSSPRQHTDERARWRSSKAPGTQQAASEDGDEVQSSLPPELEGVQLRMASVWFAIIHLLRVYWTSTCLPPATGSGRTENCTRVHTSAQHTAGAQ